MDICPEDLYTDSPTETSLNLHSPFFLEKWPRTSTTDLVTLILYQFCHCIHHNVRIWLAQTVYNCLIYIVVVDYGFTKNFVRRKYNKNRLFSTRVINWHLQIPMIKHLKFVIFLKACIYSAGVNPTNFCDEFWLKVTSVFEKFYHQNNYNIFFQSHFQLFF